MKNLGYVLSICLFFFYNMALTAQDSKIICGTEKHTMPQGWVITAHYDHGPCPNTIIPGNYKEMKIEKAKQTITVCLNSPIPYNYKITKRVRNSACSTVLIGTENSTKIGGYVIEISDKYYDGDGDGEAKATDCDDNNPDINHSAREIANNHVDENCDGIVLIIDKDKDGVNSDDDYDDNNKYVGVKKDREIPGNRLDDDANGLVDEVDNDNDKVWTYFHCTLNNCPPQDCDDNNRYAAIQRPNEIPGNGLDDDCDRLVDEVDEDGDGVMVYKLCLPGRSVPKFDCDDTDEFVYPGATERPFNDKDDDCDGMVDERDIDKDGFITYDSCSKNCPEQTDCDDNHANIYPGARDIVNNGIDENCSGKDNIVIWQMSSGGTDTWKKLNRRSPLSRNMDHLLVGDFDGDEVADIFRANGNNWVLFSGGKEEMEILEAAATIKAVNLKVGDFDGDGIADILNATGSVWRYASGGKKPWIVLKENTAKLEKLHIGDFDGDGIDDIAIISSQRVKYAARGTGDFQVVEGKTYHNYGFLIGDFNGDGQADIFNGNGNNWRVLYSASGKWRALRAQETTTDKLNVGYFNLVDADGNVDKVADIFKATSEDFRTWYGGQGGRKILKTASEQNVLLGDFNGDGVTDVFRIRTLGE